MATYQSQYTGQQIDAAVAFGMSPDATPTQNSTKGVTSGGVYAETSALKSQLDDVVLIQSTQPTSEDNKIWIPGETADEYTIPTYDEFEDVTSAINATLSDISEVITDSTRHIVSRNEIDWDTGDNIASANNYFSTGRIDIKGFWTKVIAKTGYEFRVGYYLNSSDSFTDSYIGNNGAYVKEDIIVESPYYRLCFKKIDGGSIPTGTTIYDMCNIYYGYSTTADNKTNITDLWKEVKNDITLIPTQTWESGFINASGNNANSTKYLRTNGYYTADRDGIISITLNSDYQVGIVVYNENNVFQKRIAWYDTSCSTECKKNYKYRFMILAINGDDISSLANDSTFISGIIIGYDTIHKQITDLQNTVIDIQTKSIKVLGVGNSYTWYVFKYLCKILQSCGFTDVIVGECYKGGVTLQEQYENRESTVFYDYYREYNNNGLTKTDTQSISLSTALQKEEWDYVIFQQQSDDSGQYNSFVNNDFSINDFITFVKQYQPNAKIGYVSPWTHANGYDGTKFVNYYGGSVEAQNTAINSVTPQVMALMTQCDILVDFNRLVNTARDNTVLGALGDEMLQPDKNHIAYGIPDYMCGVLYAMCLGADISNLAWYPTTTDDASITTATNNYLGYLARQAAKEIYNKM